MKGDKAVQKLHQLPEECGWSEYRLSKECGLSESTIANIFRRNTLPSISTLEAICKGFGITLSQFFSENNMIEITPETKELFDSWFSLTAKQKQAVMQMIRAFNKKQHTEEKIQIKSLLFLLQGSFRLVTPDRQATSAVL